MIKELYIYLDGGAKQLVDIDAEFNIVRNYTTPYFKDVTEVINDGTYSVKLPITENNAAIFGYLDREDMATSIPYDYLYADYYVDGLTIFTNAEVKVLSVDEESIEVQFVYGISRSVYGSIFSTKLNAITPNGTTITDADWRANWNLANTIYATGKKFVFLDYISGERTSDVEILNAEVQYKLLPDEPVLSNMKAMTNHPFIYFGNILDLINTANGTSIDFTELKTRLANKGIILSSLNIEPLFDATGSASYLSLYVATGDYVPLSVFSDGYDILHLNRTSEIELIVNELEVANREKFNITVNVNNLDINRSGLRFKLVKRDGTIYYNSISRIVGQPYNETFDVEVETGDLISFNFSSATAPFTITSGSINITSHSAGSFYSMEGNGRYDCLGNLPKINQIDFIQQCLIMTCGFIGYDENYALKVYFLDDIKNNIDTENYYDWTGRISKVTKGEFQFNSNAKKNYIKFNNDKDLIDRSEVIEVLDNTIELEKDLYTLSFDSPILDTASLPECILYEQTIKRSTDDVGNTGTTFENKYVGDNWSHPVIYDNTGVAENINIIGSYYDIYKKLVKRPIVKEVEINLGFFESAQIDFSKPVYVGDWGKYCMILEVQASDDDVSIVKLLIINEQL